MKLGSWEVSRVQAALIVAKAIVSAWLVSRVFSLDIFPVLTADSGHYLKTAASGGLFTNPVEVFMPGHYKTWGYPLYLDLCGVLADLVGSDVPMTAVVLHRVLLAAALVWLVFELGAFAFPIAVFLSSDVFLAQSNFVLTEGATIPASVILALALLRLYRLKDDDALLRRVAFWGPALLALGAYVFLILTKIPFMALAALFVPWCAELRFAGLRPKLELSWRWKVCVVPVVITGLYFVSLSVGNLMSYGKLSPSIGGDRVFYWGLWEHVFRDQPHNQKDPKLKGYYDKGSPYRYLHGVEKTCGGLEEFDCAGPQQAQRARELIEAAGLSLARERALCFAAGLFGGGKAELTDYRNRILAANGKEPPVAKMHAKMQQRFPEVFQPRDEPRIVAARGAREVKSRALADEAQAAITAVLLAFFALFVALGMVRLSSLYVASVVVYAVIIAAFAMMLIDVWRYIAPPWAAFAVLQTAGSAEALRRLYARRAPLKDVAGSSRSPG